MATKQGLLCLKNEIQVHMQSNIPTCIIAGETLIGNRWDNTRWRCKLLFSVIVLVKYKYLTIWKLMKFIPIVPEIYLFTYNEKESVVAFRILICENSIKLKHCRAWFECSNLYIKQFILQTILRQQNYMLTSLANGSN